MEKQEGIVENAELQDSIRLSNRLLATSLLQRQPHEKEAVIMTEGGVPQLVAYSAG